MFTLLGFFISVNHSGRICHSVEKDADDRSTASCSPRYRVPDIGCKYGYAMPNKIQVAALAFIGRSSPRALPSRRIASS